MSFSAATVLKSIIRQSLSPDDITGEIERQLSRLETSYNTETDIIKTLFQYCIRQFPIFYIILDALDEFEKKERNVLFRNFSSLTSLPNSKAKIFLVGRNSVTEDMRKWFPASQQKSTDCREVQADIEAYTRETINPRQREQPVLYDLTLTQEIVEALISGTDGM